MQPKYNYILTFLATLTFLCTNAFADRTLRVGSFMVNEFGKDAEAEYERSLLGLANIIRQSQTDVLALQGVRDTEMGRTQTERLVSLLNKAAKGEDMPSYEIAIGPAGGKEIATFLYRSNIELAQAPAPLLPDEGLDEQGRRCFEIMPQYARFQLNDFEFDFLSIHSTIYPHKRQTIQGRAIEFATIAQWIKQREASGEPPVILAGVSNRLLRGNVWDKLQNPDTSELLRFPAMEAIVANHPEFDPQTSLAPTLEYNTVTNQNRRRLWDTVAISKGAFDNFSQNPKWGKDVGLVAFDQEHQYLWVTSVHANTIRYLTDHRPIWIELQISN